MVSVVDTWSNQAALPSGYNVPPPAAQSLAVPVANTGQGGNWLVAVCAWRSPAAILTTVAVGDDAHNQQPGTNVWEPLGAPNGTTPLSGNVAVSVWYCRNAWPAQNVYVSPNGLVTSMAALVAEVNGLGPWATLAALNLAYIGDSDTGPSLSAAAPASEALLFAVLGSDSGEWDLTGPGTLAGEAGWTSLPQVYATNGTDYTSDCVLNTGYQVTSGSSAASWLSTGAQDMAGLLAGVLVSGTVPQAPAQDWPYAQFLTGFGAGAQTPWDQIPWTDLSDRHGSGSESRGKQYELDSIEAGTVNLALFNNDGYIMPENENSPYFPWVQPYTPARYLATWPPPPAQNARTYSVWRGYVERWPQSLTSARYQTSNAVATDVYALLTPLQRTIAQAEILSDSPYAYWPLNDPQGSLFAANLAAGNSQQLQIAQSKYGAGGATSDFNASVDYLAGDPGCTGWQQGSVPAAGIQGWCLYYQDPGLPAIAAGVTLEGEFTWSATQPTNDLTVIAVRDPHGLVIQARVNTSGQIVVDTRDKATGDVTSTTVVTASVLSGVTYHVALVFNQAEWACYVDGGAVRTGQGFCNLANSGWWLCSTGTADRTAATGFSNVTVNGLAVYGYELPQSRIISHWYSAVAGMSGQDGSGQRTDRLLGDSGCAYPRIMPAGPDLFTGSVDISGQAVGQNIVNVAESDSSWLMTDSAGYLFLQSRRGGYNLPVIWTFGELQEAPLNANSQFLYSVASWTAVNGATIAYSTAWSYDSLGSMLLTGNGSTAQPGAVAEQDPVTAGVTYTASAWMLSPAGWLTGVYAAIRWHDSGGTLLSTTSGTPLPLVANAPLQATVSGRAPAGAAFGAIAVFAEGTPPSSTGIYVGYAPLLPPTEYAYLGDIATDCDPSITYNDVALTQLAAPEVYQTTLTQSVTSGAVTLDVENANGILTSGVLLLDAGGGAGEMVTVASVSGLVIGITATSASHAANATVTVINSQASGVTITAASDPSILSFGDQTLQQTNYLADPDVITDQAQDIARQLSQPANRVANMTLDPSANPALWPVVLGLETGQVMHLNRRLQGDLLEMSGQFQVMSVAHAIGARTWRTTVSMIPYLGNVLACDDVVRGIPGSGVVLGW
jgi:hypothetical protein